MAQKININFKKLVLAAVAFAFALPLFTSGNTFAAGNACTDGPANRDALSTAIRSHNNSSNNSISTTIKLCGDISYSRNNSAVPSIDKGSVTIDLNGWSITNTNGGTALTVGRTNTTNGPGRPNYVYGSLTIVGEGEVNGTISNQYASNGASISLQGGTYTASDASTYAASGYQAYPINGKYQVAEEGLAVYGEAGSQVLEPAITAENFSVTSNYFKIYTDDDSDEYDINVRIDNPLANAFSVVLPEGSTSGIIIDIEYDGVIEIGENNTITGLVADWTKVTIYPTYNPNVSFSFFVNVYEISPSDEDEESEAIAADTIKDLIDNEWPEEPGDISDKLKEAFGEEDAEDTIYELDLAMYWGETILTNTEVTEAEPTDEEKAAIEALFRSQKVKSKNVSYYDVTISMLVDEDQIGTVHKLNKKAKIFLAAVEDPADGFKRTYYVVKYHNGEATLLKEGEGFVIEDGKIYLLSDEFSLFALGYRDTFQATSPNTGAHATETGSASASLSTVAVAAIASATLAGAAIFAKRK